MEHKTTRTIALISFLIVTTATIPLGYAYDWSPDMRLTWNIEGDWMPSIAQASDGKIWVVWHSYRTGNADIFYKVYDASQVHPWSPETRLTSDPEADAQPSIMRAKDNKIWVVWSSNRNGNYDIFYKVYDGASWSPDGNLTTDPNMDEHPSIMQASDDKIWLSWSTNRTGNFEIFYKISSDNGATWSPDTPLPYAEEAKDRDPSIMQATDGKIWVVWMRDDDIFYKTSSNNGATWSPDYGLTTDPNFDSHPSIMQASNDDIWVVWDSDRISEEEIEQDDIFYKVYDHQTKLWSFYSRLTTNLDDDFMPSIMQANDQTIWIVWISSRVNNYDIYYKTNAIPQPHDVAIFSVTPSETQVYQEKKALVSIEVVAQNHGTNAETITVRCYADSTLIGSKTFVLAPGQLYPITFPWNVSTTALGTYTVSASANIVPGETNTADNTFIDGTVQVKIPGDINGDGIVDIYDAVLLISDIDATPSSPNWHNGRSDMNNDDIVDVYDVAIFVTNYGKTGGS